MIRPEEVKAIEKYVIYVKFTDGIEGKADLSHLAGKGVFTYWDKDDNFRKVKISKKFRTIIWNDEIDISADNIYMQITGLTPEEFFKKEISEKIDA